MEESQEDRSPTDTPAEFEFGGAAADIQRRRGVGAEIEAKRHRGRRERAEQEGP